MKSLIQLVFSVFRFSRNPGSDSTGRNPTPVKNVPDPRCGAVWAEAGALYDPASLTRIVFDPMVHLWLRSLAERADIRWISAYGSDMGHTALMV